MISYQLTTTGNGERLACPPTQLCEEQNGISIALSYVARLSNIFEHVPPTHVHLIYSDCISDEYKSESSLTDSW